MGGRCGDTAPTRNTLPPHCPAHAPITRAALWMAGWRLLMVVIAVAGREATRELTVFQVMMMRSGLGLVMVWPLVHRAGGLLAMRTQHLSQHVARNAVHYAAQYGWFAM